MTEPKSTPRYQGGTTPPPKWRTCIRSARERAGISQAELARRAGLERSNLNLLEQRRRVPSVTTLIRISRALGVSIETLIDVEAGDRSDRFTWYCEDTVPHDPGSIRHDEEA